MAVDTSSLRRLLDEQEGRDVEAAREAFQRRYAWLPPVVLTEILSKSAIAAADVEILSRIHLLPILPGYWSRAGVLRARVLRDGHKARLADSLIAQSCIDHDVPLITYDRDFRHFTSAGLKLL